MLKKRLLAGIIAGFLALSFIIAPMSANALTIPGDKNLSSLFLLDKLFTNDNKTDLGDLILLNRLFQEETPTPTPAPAAPATTVSLAQQLSGRILIQVEENGEAWYVNPLTLKRIFLNGPTQAFNTFTNLALGVSNETFNSFNGTAPRRLSGRFLIKSEDAGQIYYVNPLDLSLNFVNGPTGAKNLIEKFGLGITNSNLQKITVQN